MIAAFDLLFLRGGHYHQKDKKEIDERIEGKSEGKTGIREELAKRNTGLGMLNKKKAGDGGFP